MPFLLPVLWFATSLLSLCQCRTADTEYCQWQYMSRKEKQPCRGAPLTVYSIGSTVPAMKRKRPLRQFDTPLQVRVTVEQYEQFMKAAKASGLTLSAWARTRLIQALKRDLPVT